MTLVKPYRETPSYPAPVDLSRFVMFLHRPQIRRWAARVLLLWLFGCGMGIANACLTTGQTTSAAATASYFAAAVDAHCDPASQDHTRVDDAVSPSHSADGHGQVHQGSLAKANCQDFCSKATVSIPPLKAVSDDVQLPAVIAMTAVTVLPMPVLVPVQVWVPRRDGVRARLIPIVFLRLAL